MPVYLKAITPKNRNVFSAEKIKARVKSEMHLFVEDVKRDLQEYPPQQESRRRVSVRGFVPGIGLNAKPLALTQAAALEGRYLRSRNEIRKPYKRTYNLQRSWRTVVAPDASYGLVFTDPGNPASKYAVFAQGPRGGGRGIGARQTRRMRSLGWKSITDVARERAKQYPTVMNRALKGGN